MPGSKGNGHAPPDAAVGALTSARARLAIAEHERREAIYEARAAHGERPSAVPLLAIPPARDKLPTFDELTGPEAPKARWRLAVAAVGALAALGELAREIAALVHH